MMMYPMIRNPWKFTKYVANNIHPSIEVEVDYPSLHKDDKIPILDVKVWVEERDGCEVVLHEFYTKEISLKLVCIHGQLVSYTTTSYKGRPSPGSS